MGFDRAPWMQTCPAESCLAPRFRPHQGERWVRGAERGLAIPGLHPGSTSKGREQNNCRAFLSKINKPLAAAGEFLPKVQSSRLFMAYYFQSRYITGTFDIQALKELTCVIPAPKNLTSHHQRDGQNPLLCQVAGGTGGNPGFLLYWVAAGSRGNPGVLSSESSFQSRGQCDNVCFHSIFQQEGPQNVFFAGQYRGGHLGDNMAQCEKVLSAQS